ncbi:hypothetical protein ACET3Z_012780 [Daucus carota]
MEDDNEQTYSDLMQFPIPRTESLMEKLIAVPRSGNPTLQRNAIEDEVHNGEESPLISHWSHPQHKLFLLEELENADNSDDDDDERDTNKRIDEITESLAEKLTAVHRSGNRTSQRKKIEDKVDNGEESPLISHRSHPNHKLFLLEELENADHNSDDDERDTNNRIDEMSGKNVIETEDDDEQRYSHLLQFPLPRTESLVQNLIAVNRSGNLTPKRSAIEDEIDNGKESPLINHWNHPEHKLFLLEELEAADHSSDDDERDTNKRIDEMLVSSTST